MTPLIRRWFVAILLLVPVQTHAQQVVSAHFDDISFEEMVDLLEKAHPISFHYRQVWVDSLRVNVQLENVSISELLDQVLLATDLQYFISQDGHIILSKGRAIISQLPTKLSKAEKEEGNIDEAENLFLQQKKEVAEVVIRSIENTLFEIGRQTNKGDKPTASIAGYVKDAKTGEPLVGVSVFIEEPLIGAITDVYGYYVLSLPKQDHVLVFKYVGRKDTRRQIRLAGNGQLDVELEEEILSLNEIVISGEKSQLESVQTGATKLNIEEIKNIPTLFGEADVLKISLSLPGVQSTGEGSTGFYVRGGTADQNLILLNDAVIYNPNHLFGFFSAFNPAVIKSAELYKSGIQAHYGGRISSVLDVAIRNGNKKKFIIGGGLSPVTSKLNLEGPVFNQQGSFIIGLRSTYANWLLKALRNPALNNSRAFFADFIGKINHQLNEKNNLTVSAYHSRDRFQLNADTLYAYSNTNAAVRWRHSFNNQFSSLFSIAYTNYNYQLNSDKSMGNGFELNYAIDQVNAKLDFDFFPSAQHHLRFGLQSTFYDLSPGQMRPLGELSVVRERRLDREKGLESAIYVGNEWVVSPRLSVYTGIRLSAFNAIGPGKVFLYQPDLPREVDFITDTLSYASGSIIKTYWGPEYRFSARFKLNEELSIKSSYDKTRQYIHLLTNSIAVAPTDTWRLSNSYLKPQIGDQWALGLYKEFSVPGLEISLEGYYKRIHNLLEYKDGADLLVNEAIETDVIAAFAKSYGVEFLLKKKTGQLNGWISYTYSRSLVQANGRFREERINKGAFYPANFDQPHNLSIISNYKFSRRINLSLNLTYSTGRPLTLPITQYQLGGNTLVFFSDRNQFRIPDYFRLDFALNVEGNHKIKKFGHSSWSFSIYNLTGRNNAYSVFPRLNNGQVDTYQLSIFASPIPTLIYNFELR